MHGRLQTHHDIRNSIAGSRLADHFPFQATRYFMTMEQYGIFQDIARQSGPVRECLKHHVFCQLLAPSVVVHRTLLKRSSFDQLWIGFGQSTTLLVANLRKPLLDEWYRTAGGRTACQKVL